ncbi:MAG: hypothetical protein COV75_08095 [Candidatus Omnitrophica bacterium CG11_big_fil_rev_8_21_14_0_20_63_9]|nr:MAG: hypothetical protein COV75_08095 [Candidatus Omnitrophica bacterium CG11_big_fil_rev_8_21_14_0_20_63_9]
MKARVLSLRTLLARSLWALVQPHRAVALIRSDDRLPYPRLVLTLMAGGLVFILLHSRFVLGHWVWELAYWPLIMVHYMLAGVWSWLIGVLVLLITCRWFGRRRPALVEAEIGVVYLWMSWCLMPLFDIVHLFGVPTVPLTYRLPWQHFLLGHASLLLTSPVRMLQVYFLLRALGRLTRPRAWVLAFVLSFGARFIIEPSGVVIFFVASRLGVALNFWLGQYVTMVITLVAFGCWWRWWSTGSWRRALTTAVQASAALLVVSTAAWQTSWAAGLPGAQPLPYALAPIEHAGGRIAVGPVLDGSAHEQAIHVRIPATPASCAQSLQCLVDVGSVEDGRPDDGFPWMRCDILAEQKGRDALRLQGTTQRNVTGAEPYAALWAPLSHGSRTKDTARRMTATLTVGFRGGGDYTSPDRVLIERIAVSCGGSSS